MKKEIIELVKDAIIHKSKKLSLEIGIVTTKEAEKIKLLTNLNVNGYKRIIDNYGVLHTLKNHGNVKLEESRGQIAITENDFTKIPSIVKTDNIIYSGKDRLGNDIILYEKKIGVVYYYIEEIRVGRKVLALKSMYKRKPKK